MKIDIKINKDQLDALNYALKNERKMMFGTTIIEKIYKYLFESAYSKLLKKEIDKYHDFSRKKFKISFTYPEAAALCNELNNVSTCQPYRINVCNTIQNELHQKLI